MTISLNETEVVSLGCEIEKYRADRDKLFADAAIKIVGEAKALEICLEFRKKGDTQPKPSPSAGLRFVP